MVAVEQKDGRPSLFKRMSRTSSATPGLAFLLSMFIFLLGVSAWWCFESTPGIFLLLQTQRYVFLLPSSSLPVSTHKNFFFLYLVKCSWQLISTVYLGDKISRTYPLVLWKTLILEQALQPSVFVHKGLMQLQSKQLLQIFPSEGRHGLYLIANEITVTHSLHQT